MSENKKIIIPINQEEIHLENMEEIQKIREDIMKNGINPNDLISSTIYLSEEESELFDKIIEQAEKDIDEMKNKKRQD
ncbi:MAG: hypothetical protein U0354_15465 [Candidatus Sericytochromatia bacterium]